MLIYSVVLPLIGYPLLIIAGFEGVMWQESLAAKSIVHVAVEKPQNVSLFTSMSKSSRFAIKETKSSTESLDALRKGEIDAIVRPATNGDGIEVVVNGESANLVTTKERIADLAEDERVRQVIDALRSAGRPKNFLKIFTVKMRNLAPISELSSYILPAICGFSLIMIGFGAIYPAVCAFPEEREKRTLDSTLMLPIDRFAMVLGKDLAVLIVSLMSGLVNLLSMLLVFWVLSIQPNAQVLIGNLGGGSFLGSFRPSQIALILVCFLTTAAETAAIFLFVSQASRTFKEAQNILTIPVLVMAMIPIILCFPNLNLDWTNVWVPVYNLVLTLRSAFANSFDLSLCSLAIAQNIVLSVLFLLIVGKIVGREEFLQGDANFLFALFGKQWRKR